MTGRKEEAKMNRRLDWSPTRGPKLNDRQRAHLAAALHNRKHSIAFAIKRDRFMGCAPYEVREPLKEVHQSAARRIAQNKGLTFRGVAVYRLNGAAS